MLLIKSQALREPIDLAELMKYSLIPVPQSWHSRRVFLTGRIKRQISISLRKTLARWSSQRTRLYVFIQNRNALFHALTNLPPTFGAIYFQMLDNMVAKKDFIFSTDSYYQDSVKTQERMRRGYSSIFIVDGPAPRKPADLKLFLVNEDNKTHNCVSCYCEFGEARRQRRDQRDVGLYSWLLKRKLISWLHPTAR